MIKITAKHTSLKLNGLAVMLSASIIPSELQHTPGAQELYTAVIHLTQGIALSGGRIVFGGHPTITPLVRYALKELNLENPPVDLYQLTFYKNQAPKDIEDTSVFREIHWIESGNNGKTSLADDLAKMRNAMAEATKAAIFIGGKTTKYSGNIPGIRDEYNRFLTYHPDGPIYLVGLMDGETQQIIKDLNQEGNKEPNSLTDKERQIVCFSQSIELITPVIIKDLTRQVERIHSNRMLTVTT
jgi:hypothetical protein